MNIATPRIEIAILASIVMLAFGSTTQAQTRAMSAQEYIQSTSPLAGGGSVTSVSSPQGVQTIATIASLPAATPPAIQMQQPAVTGFTPAGSTPPFGTGVAQVPNSIAGNPGAATYAYPASTPPTLAAPPANTANATFASAGAPTAAGYHSRFSTQDYQNQALAAGLNTRQVADTSYRQATAPVMATPTGQFNYAYQYGLATPATQTAAPAPQNTAAGVPEINIQIPGQPPTGAATATSTPGFVETQPVNYQNMPPGYYSGKNISGKTKSYVDGQPIRNLFRYISP